MSSLPAVVFIFGISSAALFIYLSRVLDSLQNQIDELNEQIQDNAKEAKQKELDEKDS